MVFNYDLVEVNVFTASSISTLAMVHSLHLTCTDRNCRAVIGASVPEPQWAFETAYFDSSEAEEARNGPSLNRSRCQFSCCSLSSLKSALSALWPIPLAGAAARCAPSSTQTHGASGGSPPKEAGTIGRASPAGRPSSPVAAESRSATTCRFSSVAPGAATGSPGCKRSRSAGAALRSTGTGGSSTVPSSLPDAVVE